VGPRETHPSVIRHEGDDIRAAQYRDDDPPGWLHKRLTAEDCRGRRCGGVPGLAPVARIRQVQGVAGRVVVPLGIAVPKEWARGCVVAGYPVLIEVPGGRRGDGDRVAPMATVGGPAHQHRWNMLRSVEHDRRD